MESTDIYLIHCIIYILNQLINLSIDIYIKEINYAFAFTILFLKFLMLSYMIMKNVCNKKNN